MNSLATENEMETDRSAPRLESALDATARSDILGGGGGGGVGVAPISAYTTPQPLFRAPLARHPLSGIKTTKNVAHYVLKRASENTRRLIDGPLVSRLRENAYLVVVSSFLALRENTPSCSAQTTGRKRRSGHRGAIQSSSECSGAVYGCFLGTIVSYLQTTGVSVAFTVRQIEAVLSPVAASALKTRGVDARLLCTGLASSRMVRTQLVYLSLQKKDGPLSLHSRNGNPSTMIGMCASLFVVFSLLSSSMLGSVDKHDLNSSIVFMLENHTIERVLKEANETAENALPLDGWTSAHIFELEAVDAEHRAIERAIRAVSCARRYASAHALAPASTFRKILEWYSIAAWPAGELLNERTHENILHRMNNIEYYLNPSVEAASSFEAAAAGPGATAAELTDVIPLNQLRAASASATASSYASSYASSASSSVSIASSSSNGGAADVAECSVGFDLDTFFDVRIN